LPRRVKASRDVPGAKLGGFRGMAVGLGPEIGFIIRYRRTIRAIST
jgi:hypothetical protein